MNNLLNLFLFYSFVYFVKSYSNYFRILKPSEMDCSYEYFAEKTIVIYHLNSNVSDVDYYLANPQEKIITKLVKIIF